MMINTAGKFADKWTLVGRLALIDKKLLKLFSDEKGVDESINIGIIIIIVHFFLLFFRIENSDIQQTGSRYTGGFI